jgi:hypothetical protein
MSKARDPRLKWRTHKCEICSRIYSHQCRGNHKYVCSTGCERNDDDADVHLSATPPPTYHDIYDMHPTRPDGLFDRERRRRNR